MHMAHGKKEIRKAIKTLTEDLDCTVTETSSGHRWGYVTAPDGDTASIWSTPRSPENHARDLLRWARKHQ